MHTYFKEKNKFFIYNKSDVNEYLLKDLIKEVRNYDVVYGLPYSGKTFLCKLLSTEYGYQIVDLNELVQKVKIKKNPEDPDSAEINANDIVEEVALILRTTEAKIVLENLINPLFPDLKTLMILFNKIGKPRTLYSLELDEPVLHSRYKKLKLENNTPGPLGETELEEYNTFIDVPTKVLAFLYSFNYRQITFDTSEKESISRMNFNKMNGRNIIIVKTDLENQNEELDSSLVNLSLEYDCFFFNVSKAIYQQFLLNNQFSVELKKYYSKKVNINSNEIYIKYNAINFDESILLNMLKVYMNKHYKVYENSKTVIITGLLNSELLKEEFSFTCTPILEIKNLSILGTLRGMIMMTSNQVQIDENVEEVLLEPPKKVVKPRDDLDVSGNMDNMDGADNMDDMGGNMENINMEDIVDDAADDDPEKQDKQRPFNPLNKCWSDYNGMPRTYLQILARLYDRDSIVGLKKSKEDSNYMVFNELLDKIFSVENKNNQVDIFCIETS